MVSTNQFKNGMHVEVDGTVFKLLDFQHVKPGKGGAFVRTKLRRVEDGAVIDRTFRAGEKFRPIRTETRRMQFLYADGTDAHFMDAESYEQLALPEDQVSESLKWIMPNEEIDLLYVDESPSDVQVPERRRADRHRDPAGREGRHRVGRRRQAGHARVGRRRARPAVRERGRPGASGHPLGRVRLARLVRRTDQRRAAVFALYQSEVTGREPAEQLDRDATPSRASWSMERPATAGRSTS